MEIVYIFTFFSFVGVVGILFYMVFEKAKADEKLDRLEHLESKVDSLQDYIYELEERVAQSRTPEQSEIKQKVIEMYNEGKDLMVIENALDVPRAKIEMILKFYKLQEDREIY
ncbi:hypothetical protein KKC13_12705 [bacterium]|nr:hypothetical protein [bacterium]MBU1959182.1 hypothetical protein [bacterium]